MCNSMNTSCQQRGPLLLLSLMEHEREEKKKKKDLGKKKSDENANDPFNGKLRTSVRVKTLE